MNIPNYDDDGPIAELARPPMQWITTEQPLTKRERFAMAAMQGISANHHSTENCWTREQIARIARQRADALIAELESNPQPQ